jgi:hypothetical protein
MTNDERRMMNDERRMTNDERRMTNDERRMTNDERRMTNDERRMTNDERRTSEAPLVLRQVSQPLCGGFSSNLHFQHSAPTNGLTPSPGCRMRGQTYTLHFIASPFPFRCGVTDAGSRCGVRLTMRGQMRGQTYTLHFIADAGSQMRGQTSQSGDTNRGRVAIAIGGHHTYITPLKLPGGLFL